MERCLTLATQLPSESRAYIPKPRLTGSKRSARLVERRHGFRKSESAVEASSVNFTLVEPARIEDCRRENERDVVGSFIKAAGRAQRLGRRPSPNNQKEFDSWVSRKLEVEHAWDTAAESVMGSEDMEVESILTIFHRCKLGGYINPDLFRELMHQMKTKRKGFRELTPEQVSMTVNSLGMIARDAKEAQQNTATLGRSTMYLSTRKNDTCFSQESCDFVEQLLDTCLPVIPEQMDMQACSNITHGLGLLFLAKPGISEGVPDIVRKTVSLLVKKFSQEAKYCPPHPISLSCILHGCANIQHRDGLDQVCESVQDALQDGLDFDDQAIANITWALGKLNLGSQTLWKLLGAEIVKRCDSFNPRGLGSMVYGIGQRNQGESHQMYGENAMDGLCKEISNRLHSLSNQYLASILYGLPLMPSRGKVIDELVREVEKRVALWKRRAVFARARKGMPRHLRAIQGFTSAQKEMINAAGGKQDFHIRW